MKFRTSNNICPPNRPTKPCYGGGNQTGAFSADSVGQRPNDLTPWTLFWGERNKQELFRPVLKSVMAICWWDIWFIFFFNQLAVFWKVCGKSTGAQSVVLFIYTIASKELVWQPTILKSAKKCKPINVERYWRINVHLSDIWVAQAQTLYKDWI